jgi:hypothetical protein
MRSSQASTGSGAVIADEDFVAPIRAVAPRPSPAGFLLGAGSAALLVLSLAGGSLVLSRSFVDPTAPSFEEFGLSAMPSLSPEIRNGLRGGLVG